MRQEIEQTIERFGAPEIVDGVTGVLYPSPGPEPLAKAIDRARSTRFDGARLVANAARFSEEAFRTRFLDAARAALLEAGRSDLAEGLPRVEP